MLRRPRFARLALVALACCAAGCDRLRSDPDHVTVELDGREFTLELALDTAATTRGLKGRTEIPEDGGMLFVFPDAMTRSFWMADCLVDIDIIFLDPQGRVTATHHMKVEPPPGADETRGAYEGRLPRYSSVYPAQFAIEIRGGSLDHLDVPVDSKVPLDTSRLKALAR